MQGGEPGPCHVAGLQLFGNGVVCTAANARTFADRWKSRGAVAANSIAGFGYESDEESDEIARAVLAASRETGMSLYLEIHRSSITQDSWLCLQLAERNPDLRFNLDFSHWYTGQQMSYGDFEHRLELLRPVLAKVRLLYGRIGNSCCMQVGLDSCEDP
jgi:sugar phosphate isomerase/epimerase